MYICMIQILLNSTMQLDLFGLMEKQASTRHRHTLSVFCNQEEKLPTLRLFLFYLAKRFVGSLLFSSTKQLCSTEHQ